MQTSTITGRAGLIIIIASLWACSSEPALPCSECRGDESCHEEVCLPWHQAPLSVDFAVVVDGLTITCEVDVGGFPRDRVDTLRFDFGDGYAGYGETIAHEYARPGVYPVTLVVRLQGYRVVTASKLASVGTGLGASVFLTVNQTPDYLNGSLPFTSDNWTPWDDSDDYSEDFHLLLASHGFSVDIELLDAPGASIDVSSLTLTADQPLGEGALPAGTNLADRLGFGHDEHEQIGRGQWLVDASAAFPAGMVTLTLAASDTAGGLHDHELTFEIIELTPEIDPFDRPMAWLFRFDMDLYSSTSDGGGGIATSTGSNGVSDFAEELAVIGARGDESAPGATTVEGRGQVGANAIFERWIIDEIIDDVRRYYHIAPDGSARDGIAITFHVAGDPEAPTPAEFASDGEFSVMRFGGALTDAFGRSRFSIYNHERVDDSSVDLGVGTSTLVSTLVTTAIIVDDFYPILPGAGTPVGDHPADPLILADDFDRYALDNDPADNSRYDELAEIARQLGMIIAAVTAHEMGHAMGLVPNDAPPLGFFGDRADITFIGAERTNSHHVDFPFLNLMQAGGNPLVILNDALKRVEIPDGFTLKDLLMILAVENRLSPYSRAYFKRAQSYLAF